MRRGSIWRPKTTLPEIRDECGVEREAGPRD
jgi:hypothetical protein